ncbi:hypothetical protein IEQ34_021477 [Dendrobium chrysotoxum]|uniref:Uncharacterized protein n=1 Tax=Dendrobium chrysotoxum TaxID=161865 RepID=A0AAV7G4T5_DENCH|nr:hypothetical protein IEQ34_021477 [Dendrobium chrysotoxum]
MEAAPSSSNPSHWGNPLSVSMGGNKGFFCVNGNDLNSKSQSFCDVLTNNAPSKDSSFIFRKSLVKGLLALLILDEDIVKLASPYQFTLVGKFSI